MLPTNCSTHVLVDTYVCIFKMKKIRVTSCADDDLTLFVHMNSDH